MDIRNPRLDEYINIEEVLLIIYLQRDLKLEDLIVKYEGYEDFHILLAVISPIQPSY
jgi:hypothetical protein